MTRTSHEKWNKRVRRRRRFLDAFARSGSVSAGANAAGVSLQTVARWLWWDYAFCQRFQEARARFQDAIRERLVRQAFQGNGPTLRYVADRVLPDYDESGAYAYISGVIQDWATECALKYDAQEVEEATDLDPPGESREATLLAQGPSP